MNEKEFNAERARSTDVLMKEARIYMDRQYEINERLKERLSLPTFNVDYIYEYYQTIGYLNGLAITTIKHEYEFADLSLVCDFIFDYLKSLYKAEE